MKSPILRIEQLGVTFHTHHGVVTASQNVNLTINHGELWGIVGASGSGKSVCMMAIARLLPEYAQVHGAVFYENQQINHLPEKAFSQYRGGSILYLFQDSLSALNPYMRVGKQLSETLKLYHHNLSKQDLEAKMHQLLLQVELHDTQRILTLYPHQCSGGMRQRILLALGLACNPTLLIADEPTSALDAISAARIMQLLQQIQQERNLTVIIISHDLAIVSALCSHIAVFQGGTIVEQRTTTDLLANAEHPYTQKLLHAMQLMR